MALQSSTLPSPNLGRRSPTLGLFDQALESFCHPFITALTAYYQDASYLYLLMELAIGGELGSDQGRSYGVESATYFYGVATYFLPSCR